MNTNDHQDHTVLDWERDVLMTLDLANGNSVTNWTKDYQIAITLDWADVKNILYEHTHRPIPSSPTQTPPNDISIIIKTLCAE